MLELNSSVPLYEQLMNAIRSDIDSGLFKAGEKMPSEMELEEKYQVSRITVRRAIKELCDDEILVKKQGKGTFVLQSLPPIPLAGNVGFHDYFEAKGLKVTSSLVEKKIVKTELGHVHTVAWYRNQPKNLNYSLSIPYSMNGQMANMYPDFIFFQNVKGKIIRTIVDPHGDWLGDSIAKLQGYVDYLRDFPDMFGSVLAVVDEPNGECRYLELTDAKVQAAIKSFTGNTAKALFTGPYSKEYMC